MTIEDHNKYTAWLNQKDPYENYHVMKKSTFDLDGKSNNMMLLLKDCTIVMSAPTNRLSSLQHLDILLEIYRRKCIF